jgi:hypothetical protein
MTAVFIIVLLFAQQAPATLDQIRAEPNPERRARAAVEFAAAAERNAESAYSKGDMKAVTAELNNMVMGVETAQQALQETGKSPLRHPGPFKSGELRTEEILVRLGDLALKMDADERATVDIPKAKVQEVHDAWFDGIMSRKKR